MKTVFATVIPAAISLGTLLLLSPVFAAQPPVPGSQTPGSVRIVPSAEEVAKEEQAYRDYDEGKTQFKKNNYTAAIASFQKALSRNVFAYEKLGDIYTVTGQNEKAIEAYHEAISTHGYGSTSVTIRMKYALLLHQARRYDEALYEYQKGLECLDDHRLGASVTMEVNRQNMATKQLVAGAHLALGVYYLNGNYDESVRQCAEVLRLKPGYGGTYLCLAECLGYASSSVGKQFGKYSNKVALYKAIELGPGPVRKAAQAMLDRDYVPNDRTLTANDKLIIPSASALDIAPDPPVRLPLPAALPTKPTTAAR